MIMTIATTMMTWTRTIKTDKENDKNNDDDDDDEEDDNDDDDDDDKDVENHMSLYGRTD